MEVLNTISESLQRGNHPRMAELTRQAIDSGLETAEIGADRHSDDAGSAMELVARLMGAP